MMSVEVIQETTPLFVPTHYLAKEVINPFIGIFARNTEPDKVNF